MKKIFLSVLFFALAAFLLTVILMYKNITNNWSPSSNLNKFEKKFVKQLEKYSIESKNAQKESVIYFTELTDKKFERVATIGCYDVDWNKTAKLPKNLEEKVNKKIGGIPEDFFTTILLINKNDVAVLKINREMGDVNPQQFCENFENCYVKFVPKEKNIIVSEKKH